MWMSPFWSLDPSSETLVELEEQLAISPRHLYFLFSFESFLPTPCSSSIRFSFLRELPIFRDL